MQLRKGLCLLLVVLFSVLQTIAQSSEEPPKKIYTTDQLRGIIEIDGYLDDEAWNQVEWGGDFIGHRPEFNVVPTQETQFKILYDAKFLYVAIRAFDTEPEKIQRRMTRRDGFDGDRVTIMIDSYHDKRTAFSFTACASGVKGEEYVSNNGDSWDSTWDPIWYLKTSIDDQGWVAEFKIPLSQLRFANKESHVWGLQVSRNFFRGQERNTWQPVDPNAQGWVHLFGELHGIRGIRPQKQLEVQPYLLSSYQTYPKEEGNPFRSSGKEYSFNAGLDAKIGITSDITLDVTVNPDFGQVDADPSNVNLSAFQLFFQERRPFFLEGGNLLTFRTSGGPNNLFYSRRIGARPKGNPFVNDDVEYADIPNQTPILGAFKLTGKNANGFSWGVMESLTNEVDAEVTYLQDSESHLSEASKTQKVEPYTNYLVGRVQQDIDGGKTVIGALATHVKRFDNSGNDLEYLHDNAVSAGIDLDHNFKDRKYGFEFKAMFSNVVGSQGAIYQTQTSSQRNFQRPDNFYKDVDSSRTSLTGTAGTLAFGKRSGNWRWTFGSNYRSPELELDDAGFLRQTDDINNWFWTQYRIPKVTKLFRWQSYNFYTEINHDFGGAVTNRGFNFNMNVQFKNFWEFGNGFWIGGSRFSNADLRGGPAFKYPGNINYWMYVGTNSSKKVSFSVNPWINWGNDDSRKSSGISFDVNARPTDALQLTFSPGINWRRDDLQWVQETTNESVNETRYILGRIDQESFSASLRANYNISPNLTIEFWGQPFFFFGDYSQFKFVTDPDAEAYYNRFDVFDNQQIVFDATSDTYLVDEDRNGTTDYSFGKPDFNFFQLQTNMVMRWEYVPGSTLFLVWSSNGTSNDVSRMSDAGNVFYSANNISTTHTFLIKYTYRFIL